MTVYHEKIQIKSKGEHDIIDITNYIKRCIESSGLRNGICCVFVPGSTGNISTIEFEPGLKKSYTSNIVINCTKGPILCTS